MVVVIVMNIPYFGEVSRLIVIGVFFVWVWIIFTGIYYGAIIHVYTNSNLPNALLTIDTIFFGATVVITSILIAQFYNRNEDNDAIEFIAKLRALSSGISILIVANIASYFTVGLLQVICIYYQVWTLPAFILVYYMIFKNPTPIPQSDQNKITS